MKTCAKCGSTKVDGDFYPGSTKSCKECTRAAVRANRAKNIDHYLAYDRSRANDPARVAARDAYAKTPDGRAAGSKAKRRWAESNPARRAASHLVNNRIRDGVLSKPKRCDNCGAGGRIHGHHDDYTKPLDVRWLCPKCHKAWHAVNTPKG